MDMRTGRSFEGYDAAVAAGAKPNDLATVEAIDQSGRLVEVASGPFRGRVYEVSPEGVRGRRRKDVERARRKDRATRRRAQAEPAEQLEPAGAGQ